jgi:hypothetical protein
MSNRGIALIATVVGLVGLFLLADAAATAVRHFSYNSFDCGSVINAKDPRNLLPPRARVTPRYENAYKHCQTLRTERSDRATKLLVAGAVIVLAALITPAIIHRSRRLRRRRGAWGGSGRAHSPPSGEISR